MEHPRSVLLPAEIIGQVLSPVCFRMSYLVDLIDPAAAGCECVCVDSIIQLFTLFRGSLGQQKYSSCLVCLFCYSILPTLLFSEPCRVQ